MVIALASSLNVIGIIVVHLTAKVSVPFTDSTRKGERSLLSWKEEMKNIKTEAQASSDSVTHLISRLTLESVPFQMSLPLQIWRYLSEFVPPCDFLRLHRCNKGIRDGTRYLCYSRVILTIEDAGLHKFLEMKASCNFLVEHVAGFKSRFVPLFSPEDQEQFRAEQEEERKCKAEQEEEENRSFRSDLEILAFANRLDVIKALFDYRPRLWKDANKVCEHAIANACLGGHIDLLKYLCTQGVSLNWGCWVAAEYFKGCWPLIHFLHQHHCPFHPNVLAQTACYGQVKVIKWFIRNGYAESIASCEDAIKRTAYKRIKILLKKQIRKLHSQSQLAGSS